MCNVDINNSHQIQPPVFTTINYVISKQELPNAKDTGRSDEKKSSRKICKQPAKITSQKAFQGRSPISLELKINARNLSCSSGHSFFLPHSCLVLSNFYKCVFLEDVHSLTLVLNYKLFVTIFTEWRHTWVWLSQHVRKKQSVRSSAGNLTQ